MKRRVVFGKLHLDLRGLILATNRNLNRQYVNAQAGRSA